MVDVVVVMLDVCGCGGCVWLGLGLAWLGHVPAEIGWAAVETGRPGVVVCSPAGLEGMAERVGMGAVEEGGARIAAIAGCKTSAIRYDCRRYVIENWSDRLDGLFQGATVLRSRDLEERGLARARIADAVKAGELERVGRGLYALPGAELTEHHSLVQAARRVPGGVVCLLSALRFHELTSQNPHEVWLAIRPKDRLPAPGTPPLKIVRFGDGHFRLGQEAHEVEGTRIKVYSVARTVVDLFRYRNKIGIDVALEALKEGWRERRFALKEVNGMAARCRMTQVMKPYLEALTA